MTPEYLARLKKLCDKATPGPWGIEKLEKNSYPSRIIFSPNKRAWDENDEEYNSICEFNQSAEYGYGCDSHVENDSDFIVESREAVPALIQEVERLNRILLQELSEDDELGAEYSYILAMKGENARLREALSDIATLHPTLGTSEHVIIHTLQAIATIAINSLSGSS